MLAYITVRYLVELPDNVTEDDIPDLCTRAPEVLNLECPTGEAIILEHETTETEVCNAN